MSANPKELLKPASSLSVEATRPFPNSRKIFVPGPRPDIRVGMREVTLTPTPSRNGAEENPPVTIYDTSGPYSDPAATIDLRQGLAPLRKPWILDRNDTEQLGGPSPNTAARASAIRISLRCVSSTSASRAVPRAGRTCRRCTTRAKA